MIPRFTVNDRTYISPGMPVVVICIDGSEPDYHLAAMAAGQMPWLSQQLENGSSSWPAHCVMPALTNPNNLSIATGRPPAVHGISGNYFFDVDRGEEVLMNDARFLRAPTIFAAANDAGWTVAVVTAKDKLRRLLGAGLINDDGTGICFSAEKADEATVTANGIGNVLDLVGRPRPEVYSADLSEFALAAGVELLKGRRPELMYLSLTDYIQHKFAPGTPTANAFYAMIDSYASRLAELGAIVVLTADHGMSAKTDDAGAPKVLYLEDHVRHILGAGTDDSVRVILPITDPYTAHHGALGSFASVYLPADVDSTTVAGKLAQLNGIEAVHTREEAAALFELPPDRIGDIVVLAEADTAVGRYADWHDLSGLDAPLRSHGALGELQIPFIINRQLPRPEPLTEAFGQPACVHNYDAFWVATTMVAQHTRRISVSAAAQQAR
jgi:phosphonoacetate hydrolase